MLNRRYTSEWGTLFSRNKSSNISPRVNNVLEQFPTGNDIKNDEITINNKISKATLSNLFETFM